MPKPKISKAKLKVFAVGKGKPKVIRKALEGKKLKRSELAKVAGVAIAVKR